MKNLIFRLVPIILLIIILFLPWEPTSKGGYTPAAIYVIWTAVEILPILTRISNSVYFLNAVSLSITMLSIPFLIGINFFLWLKRLDWLTRLYRLGLLLLMLVAWYTSSLIEPSYCGMGCQAFPGLLSLVALIELSSIVIVKLNRK
jgi:hypothetical protein